MPQNTRNFFITTRCDGHATVKGGGPRAKDGGFTTEIEMRDKGKITKPLRIRGWINQETGKLTLDVEVGDSYEIVHRIETER